MYNLATSMWTNCSGMKTIFELAFVIFHHWLKWLTVLWALCWCMQMMVYCKSWCLWGPKKVLDKKSSVWKGFNVSDKGWQRNRLVEILVLKLGTMLSGGDRNQSRKESRSKYWDDRLVHVITNIKGSYRIIAGEELNWGGQVWCVVLTISGVLYVAAGAIDWGAEWGEAKQTN